MIKRILFLFFVIQINAQDVKEQSFTLDEAIKYGLENNRNLILAGKDIQVAKEKKWETTAMGLPQVNAGLDYLNNIQIQRSLIPAEIFGGPAGTFAEVAFGTKHTVNARASLQQLIFDGSYLVALESAKVFLDIFDKAKAKTEVEIKATIINSYCNVLLIDENIKILEKNIVSLEKTLFETSQYFKNGLIEEENVEQLTITLSTLKNTMNNSTRQRKIALDMLKIMIGLELNNQLNLKDNLESITQKNNSLPNTTFDFNNNIDYIIQKNNETQKKLLLKLEKSKYLPSLAANLNFGYNSFGNEFNFFNSNQRWLNYSNVGVSLNVPVFSSFARKSRSQQAKIELEKATIQLNDLQENLKLQHQAALSNYQFSLEEYQNSKTNLKLAERIENKQKIKFKEGLTTSFEFTDAQRQLFQAQQNVLQAMIQVINNKTKLDKLIQ
jgi:outer membrane protein